MLIKSVDVDSNMSYNFSIHLEKGRKDYLFVLFKTPAMLWVNNEFISVTPGTGVFFDKHMLQSYHGTDDVEFVHDFLLFDTENNHEKMLLSSIRFGIPFNIRTIESVSLVLRMIKQETLNRNKYAAESISALSLLFFYKIKNELSLKTLNGHERAHYDAMEKLREEIYAFPEEERTIEKMSDSVFLSRFYFQRLYKEFFGISVIQDVICARIEKAKKMLTTGNLSISEISEKCGYKNPEHFIRQFKNLCNETPKRFREKL